MYETRTSAVLRCLEEVAQYYPHSDIAEQLGVNPSTVSRWLKRETEPKPYVLPSLQQMLMPLGKPADSGDFTFIDLFAGIGGIRKAFELHGGRCVFTSEWDAYAQRTYHANFADGQPIAGDITAVYEAEVPTHDVLLAGFPCQPFSIAGVSKKNALGRAHGFADETQGTLFFDVARIIKAKRPGAFLLENVKNLQSHDKGRTFKIILHTLREELGYQIHWMTLDGQHWTPQHRERTVIVGFRDPTAFSWNALQLPEKGQTKMRDILHRTDGTEPVLEHDDGKYFDHQSGKVLDKYTLTPNLWKYLQDYAAKHKAKGNGFGFGLVYPDSIARTLSARYYKDGSEILVWQGEDKSPRRLTPRECARLMGYPDDFRIPVSDTRAYKQFGNSVVMPVFREVARIMKPWIMEQTYKPLIVDMWANQDDDFTHVGKEAEYVVSKNDPRVYG
jgi:DNA (cytosine-5)-methyltransferase 1